MTKNLVWRFVENVYVGVHNNNPPSQAEWDGMIEALHQAKTVKVALIHSEGGSPSAVQRKQLRETTEALGMKRSAILTDSIIARTAITAINLFSKGFSTPFAPQEIDAALTFLEVPPEGWATIKKELAALKRELSLG